MGEGNLPHKVSEKDKDTIQNAYEDRLSILVILREIPSNSSNLLPNLFFRNLSSYCIVLKQGNYRVSYVTTSEKYGILKEMSTPIQGTLS